MSLILSLEYRQPPIITIAQYSRKRKRPHDVFDILHATRIDGRPNIACWISDYTRNAARLGLALSLRSTVNLIAEDKNPIPVTEDALVVLAFDTISEVLSFPPPTTVSLKTSQSSTRTRLLLPKKRACYSAPPFTSSPIPLTAADTELINNILIDAFDIAEKWRSTNTTESHYISVVKKNKLGNENIIVFNIASIKISPPKLCPYSSEPDLFKDLDKKINYASINQTASFTNYYPIFLNIEVKRNYIAAEFRKRQLKGWSLSIPIFALLYIVTAEEILKKLDEFNMFFLGLLRLGDTYSIDDIKRLFDNLYDITLWG
ncbi:hypothetical protein V2W45_1520405 [Cenococcum geophilum]